MPRGEATDHTFSFIVIVHTPPCQLRSASRPSPPQPRLRSPSRPLFAAVALPLSLVRHPPPRHCRACCTASTCPRRQYHCKHSRAHAATSIATFASTSEGSPTASWHASTWIMSPRPSTRKAGRSCSRCCLPHTLDVCGTPPHPNLRLLFVQSERTARVSLATDGCSSLDQDAKELSALLCHIDKREAAAGRRPVNAFALVGHSTGCQDAVTVLRGAHLPDNVRAKIRAAVLQAPVSDRESDSLLPDATGRAALLAEAEALVAAGDGHKLVSTLHNGFVPISAARYASLNGRLGPDDMFSSDLSDDELEARLGHMSTAGQRAGVPTHVTPLPDHPGLRTCFCLSGADEYVPPTVDVPTLARRFTTAAGGEEAGAEAVILDGAAHNCVDHGAEFVQVVCRVLAEAVPP